MECDRCFCSHDKTVQTEGDCHCQFCNLISTNFSAFPVRKSQMVFQQKAQRVRRYFEAQREDDAEWKRQEGKASLLVTNV